MADRKSNLLVTMVFDENSDIRKQIDTEHEVISYIRNGLQHAIVGKEIKHFVIADDEVINKKLTEEREAGEWLFAYGNKGKDNVEKCSCCGSHWKEAIIYASDTKEYIRTRLLYCPNCGAEMRGA